MADTAFACNPQCLIRQYLKNLPNHGYPAWVKEDVSKLTNNPKKVAATYNAFFQLLYTDPEP